MLLFYNILLVFLGMYYSSFNIFQKLPYPLGDILSQLQYYYFQQLLKKLLNFNDINEEQPESISFILLLYSHFIEELFKSNNINEEQPENIISI